MLRLSRAVTFLGDVNPNKFCSWWKESRLAQLDGDAMVLDDLDHADERLPCQPRLARVCSFNLSWLLLVFH